MARSRAKQPQPGSTYWDTTVFLDLFFQEGERAGIAKALWQEALAGKHSICTSFLTIAEVLFTAAEINKNFKSEEEAAIKALWHPKSPVKFVDITAAIGNDARALKRECMVKGIPLQSADALHLACARAVPAERFFTSDQFNRPPCKKAKLADQRENLSKIAKLTICEPKASGVIVFKSVKKASPEGE